MTKIYIRISSFFIAFISVFQLYGSTEDVVFTALQDEMERSMQELQYKDYEKPFFISYELNKKENIRIEAKLGTIIYSQKRKSNLPGMRLMVGDYQMTDEKFSDKVNRVNHNDGGAPLPVEDDYWAIRRTFWIMTNNTYKNAAVQYRNKQTALQENEMTKSDLPSPDFSREEPNELVLDNLPDELSIDELEDWAREISLVFKEDDRIVNSAVNVEYLNNTRYFINTEGTKLRIPYRFYFIRIKASAYNSVNLLEEQYLNYYAKSVAELPDVETIKKDARHLANNVVITANAELFRGIYEGPVLLKQEAVSEILLQEFLQKGSGLISEPKPIINTSSRGLYLSQHQTWEDRIGQKVVDKSITVYSLPVLESYNGIPLLGTTTKIDLEGVARKDTLLLIERGKLRSQFNNRLPNTMQLNSNGNQNFYVSRSSVSDRVGPDVLKFNITEKRPVADMKSQLKELAIEEELDYMFIVRPMESSANKAPLSYYKVDVRSGEATLVRCNPYLAGIGALKNLEAVSDRNAVHNFLMPDRASINKRMESYKTAPPDVKNILLAGMALQGTPTSFIYPDAILLKNAEIKGSNQSLKSKLPVVPRP